MGYQGRNQLRLEDPELTAELRGYAAMLGLSIDDWVTQMLVLAIMVSRARLRGAEVVLRYPDRHEERLSVFGAEQRGWF